MPHRDSGAWYRKWSESSERGRGDAMLPLPKPGLSGLDRPGSWCMVLTDGDVDDACRICTFCQGWPSPASDSREESLWVNGPYHGSICVGSGNPRFSCRRHVSFRYLYMKPWETDKITDSGGPPFIKITGYGKKPMVHGWQVGPQGKTKIVRIISSAKHYAKTSKNARDLFRCSSTILPPPFPRNIL